MKPAERNAFVATRLNEYISRVRAGEAPAHDRYKPERKVLERLIPIATDGFRGVALTAIMGKLVREDINTSTEFHAINPRAVFEDGIFDVLVLHRIPTKKSPPLNVAKNVQVLDEKWAEGRDPEDAALAAVDYVRRVNSHWSDPAMRDDLILIFIQRLLAYADEVGSHDVNLAEIDGLPPLVVAKRLATFAIAFPEGGSIPQFVVGVIIAAARVSDTDYSSLDGVEASVFGTNTTSNKPADLWETMASGDLNNLYEVTCKAVDASRLSAAVESYSKLNLPTTPITFICRLPKDAATLELDEGVATHKGVPFQFLDITAFIESNFVMLTPAKRVAAVERIAAFVAEPSRAIKTKNGWAMAFGE